MPDDNGAPLARKVKDLVLGKPLDPADRSVFRKLSLVAFFAWVALGADGLSSSCYGPPEAYLALGEHAALSVFVAAGTAVTIFVISAAYSQIIELFPTGGGGYLVASKLLSPTVGMVSGCALLIDYLLVITLSVASGADAVFSFLPVSWQPYRLAFAVAGVVFLTLLNLRGVKESVMVLVPIFMAFVLSHAVVIGYGLLTHFLDLPAVVARLDSDVRTAHAELGLSGLLLLVLRAYSLGAGTYTGIEAVSNGLPILRAPRAETGKRTMLYMSLSLALTVVGLICNYLLFRVQPQEGKTLNAALFAAVTAGWDPGLADGFVLLTLVSEGLLLLTAAQTGFVGGPRVLANMALDRWFPSRFALLSDRLVTSNGILLMGGAGLLLMLVSGGSVKFLIVLFSINVFITFVLSQLGMVRHWWMVRGRAAHWRKGLWLNGLGLTLTTFILATVVLVKFDEGGWITMGTTSVLVVVALGIKRHYRRVGRLIGKLDMLRDVLATGADKEEVIPRNSAPAIERDPSAPTAVIFVNGFNGLGIHILLSVLRLFSRDFKNYVFVQIGVVNAGVFKGASELSRQTSDMMRDLSRYVEVMNRRGYYAESHQSVGTDVVHEILTIAPAIQERFPKAVFFVGQVVFERDTFFTRLLHNSVTFILQRQFSRLDMPLMILPIMLERPMDEVAARLLDKAAAEG